MDWRENISFEWAKTDGMKSPPSHCKSDYPLQTKIDCEENYPSSLLRTSMKRNCSLRFLSANAFHSNLRFPSWIEFSPFHLPSQPKPFPTFSVSFGTTKPRSIEDTFSPFSSLFPTLHSPLLSLHPFYSFPPFPSPLSKSFSFPYPQISLVMSKSSHFSDSSA